jgi:hypothetical protein
MLNYHSIIKEFVLARKKLHVLVETWRIAILRWTIYYPIIYLIAKTSTHSSGTSVCTCICNSPDLEHIKEYGFHAEGKYEWVCFLKPQLHHRTQLYLINVWRQCPYPLTGYSSFIIGTDCIGSCKSNYHTIMTTI